MAGAAHNFLGRRGRAQHSPACSRCPSLGYRGNSTRAGRCCHCPLPAWGHTCRVCHCTPALNPPSFKLWIPPQVSLYLRESGCTEHSIKPVGWPYSKGLGRWYPSPFAAVPTTHYMVNCWWPRRARAGELWQEAQLPAANTRPATASTAGCSRHLQFLPPNFNLIPGQHVNMFGRNTACRCAKMHQILKDKTSETN